MNYGVVLRLAAIPSISSIVFAPLCFAIVAFIVAITLVSTCTYFLLFSFCIAFIGWSQLLVGIALWALHPVECELADTDPYRTKTGNTEPKIPSRDATPFILLKYLRGLLLLVKCWLLKAIC